jgi:hypothetical protein
VLILIKFGFPLFGQQLVDVVVDLAGGGLFSVQA